MKSEARKEVYESHNDVNKYEKLFKNELNYHSVIKMTDEKKKT